MRPFSSLRGRIFLTSALLAVFPVGVAIFLVNSYVAKDVETELRREIEETNALIDQLQEARTQTFMTMARFIANTSQLKAAVDTGDPPTIQDNAEEYQQQLKSSLLLVTDRTGAVLATVGTSQRTALVVASQPAVREALIGHESVGLVPQPDGVLQLVTVPITLYRTNPQVLGTLSVGFLLDDTFAVQLKEATGSDIAVGMDGQILATTLPRADRAAMSELVRSSTLSTSARVGTEDYMVLPRPLLASQTSGLPPGAGPVMLILRSRNNELQLLRTIRTNLGIIAAVAVLLATLLSFTIARTITRPLAAITDVMRKVATTGDLTRKIALRPGHRWDDEDARLLAATFNTLIDSIAHFQREIGHREKLSSLGRLSTVIAHEIRNPLMIIKASVHALRRKGVSAEAAAEAITDIDEEVVRLNRMVTDVLDFARPIQFTLSRTDLNALCRDSAVAAQMMPGPPVHLDLDGTLPAVTTDPERLRMALVDMLDNARHAVEAAGTATPPATAPDGGASRVHAVELQTRAAGNRVTILIADRGVGIDPADLPRVFDPYFSTRRGGSGLGLAITKNIIEGLGGTIGVASTSPQGTKFRIDLPLDSTRGRPVDLAQSGPVDPPEATPSDLTPDGPLNFTQGGRVGPTRDRPVDSAQGRPTHG